MSALTRVTRLLYTPQDAVIGDDEDMDIRRVYTIMYRICKLKRASALAFCFLALSDATANRVPTAPPDVQKFALVHLVSKLGAAAHDAATSLKLLEKGLSKEDLALAVLIDFPFQILFGWLAARWSTGERPLRPVSTTPSDLEWCMSLLTCACLLSTVGARDVGPAGLCRDCHATHSQFPGPLLIRG